VPQVLDSVVGSLGGWQATLASLSSETRLYDLTIEGCDAPLWVESFVGTESVSGFSVYRVNALSTDAQIDLGTLRWRHAQLRIRLADGGSHLRSGHVRVAQALRAEGGLAHYLLELVPWNWLLTQQTHSRIWQDQPLSEILGDVFGAYADAQWGFAEGTETAIASFPVRPYCVQYRESDHEFVVRLLAEEGLGWIYEDSEDLATSSRLLIFADSTLFKTADGPDGIRFHRAGGTEGADAIQRLASVHRLSTNTSSLVAFDPASKRSLGSSAASSSTQPASTTVPATLESYRWSGHGLITDSGEAARRSRLMQEAHDARQSLHDAMGTVRSLRPGQQFTLTQSLLDGWPSSPDTNTNDQRRLAVLSLHCVGINNLPSERLKSLDASDALTLFIQSIAALNSDDAIEPPTAESLFKQAREHGYAGHWQLQPAGIAWRPAMAGQRRRQTAPGPQSAIVVDASGSTRSSDEIHRDQYQRIRVRFHWQQDAGNDSAHTSAASTWLRLASRAAGPGRGASFVPRLGQEVLVGFLDQDIDQPLIIGALYNGRGEGGDAATPAGRPASASDGRLYAQAQDRVASAQGNVSGGNSPAWHSHSAAADGHQNPSALTGYKTREFQSGGQGYNQLALEDRDEQLRIQLKTTQATTELNLGNLIHQADNHLGSTRGTGFEVRTDQGGTIRAGKGVLIESRRGQTPAKQPEPSGDFTAGISLLTQAQSLAKSYDEMATAHHATGLSLNRGSAKADSSHLDGKSSPAAALTKAAQSKISAEDASPHPKPDPQGAATSVPHLGAAVVALSAKAQLAVIAGQAIQLAAGETIATLSGQDQDHAIGGSLSIHSGQSLGILAGIQQNAVNPALSLITAKDPLRIEAQNSTMNLDAKLDLKLVSVSQSLEAAAKTAITLTTKAGAMIRIEGGNITVQCPGALAMHAAKHEFTPGTQLSREMNSWPETKFDEKVQIVGADEEPLPNYRYKMHRADGAMIEGVTDGNGWTSLQKAAGIENLDIELLGPVGSA